VVTRQFFESLDLAIATASGVVASEIADSLPWEVIPGSGGQSGCQQEQGGDVLSMFSDKSSSKLVGGHGFRSLFEVM